MPGRLDLLRESRGKGPEGPREQRPGEEGWRADALARSRHSRLDREADRPQATTDPTAAARLCAEVTRKLLGDFAPALILLGAAERRRVQALAAYAFTLFDFAREHGMEGERLAAINRWEFALEAALTGQPAAQPVFLRMAEEHRRRPWSQAGLDGLARAARSRISRPRPRTSEEAGRRARDLAGSAAEALLGDGAVPELAELGAGLLRLEALQALGNELRARRCPLPESEVPEPFADEARDTLLEAVRRECQALRPRLLAAGKALAHLPRPYRRAGVFLLLAGLRLLSAVEEADRELLEEAPRLGLFTRLGFLLRARWLGERAL